MEDVHGHHHHHHHQQHQQQPESGYMSNRWMDLGNLHQARNGPHHPHQQPHDFGLYGFVEPPQLPQEASFRLPPTPMGQSYYQSFQQWSLPTSGPPPILPSTASASALGP